MLWPFCGNPLISLSERTMLYWFAGPRKSCLSLCLNFWLKSFTDLSKTLILQVYMTHEELHNDELLQFGGLEFPQINYHQFNGRPYRYFYSCGFGHVFSDSLLKMDVHTKELKVFYQSKATLRETSLLTEPGITTSKLFLLLFLYHSEGSSRLCELVF